MAGDRRLQEEPRRLRDMLRAKGCRLAVRELSRFFFERLTELKLGQAASGMALASILGLVPVLALSLAVFAAFPSFETSRAAVEQWLLTSFLPEQYTEVLIRYLREFSAHAAGLTAFGLIGLAVTVVLLINELFDTLNEIFRIRHPRPLGQRVLIYWSLLTLGPIVLALSLTLTGQFAALMLSGLHAGFSNTLNMAGEILIEAMFFALVYKFVPNCSVRFTHAFVGGLVVTLVNLLVKRGFAYYVAAGTLSNIYGAFAAIPVLVLWIYVAWYLFFAGAALTAVMPRLISGRYIDEYRLGNDLLTGLRFLEAFLVKRAQEKTAVLSVFELSEQVDASPETTRHILERLSEAGYVKPLDETEGRECWAFIADPGRVTASRAFEVLSLDSKNTLLATKGTLVRDWYDRLHQADVLSEPLSQLFRKKA